MLVSRSAYYAWLKRPAKVISATTLNLYRRIRTLFKESRGSLGNREMVKKLRKEGFVVGRYKVRSIMKSLGLKAVQRQAYKVTTKRKTQRYGCRQLTQPKLQPCRSKSSVGRRCDVSEDR